MDRPSREELIAELNDIIRARHPHMMRNYPRVRDAYVTQYVFPELDPLRSEISLCLILGLYEAAITLTNHLLESMLKYALIYRYAKGNQRSSPPTAGGATRNVVDWLAEGNKLYADRGLGDNINAACRKGLITKAQKKLLEKFRVTFRDAFSHADKMKTFGDATTSVTALHAESNTLVASQPEQVRLAAFLFGQGVFQVALAQQNALPYFLKIDAVARHILAKLFPGQHVTAP
jgi:hypothetical protein